MAENFTDNLKLSKRDTGDLNWGAGANANLDVVDGHAQLKNLRPPRTLTASLGSGGVGANLTGSTTYFYKITSINELGETTENKIPAVTEAQITEPASPVPVILSWETVPGASGYKIYKGTSANSELLLAQVSGGATAVFTDTGNTATQAGQNVPALNTALLSVTGVRKQGEASPLRGDVKLEAGPNVVLTQDPVAGKITIEATGGSGGVTSVRKEGEAVGLLGDVKLRAGSNIALTQDGPGNAVEIAATGGGGVTSLRKFGDPTGLTGDVKIDQGSDITVAQDVPNNKIVVNYSGPKGYATVIAPAPNGSNDTAYLQAALDAIPAASGGRVILREGEYIVDTLTISRFGTHLVGSGPGHENILTVPSGTRIRLTGLFTSNVQCNAEASMIENISFVCDTMGQNSSAVNCAGTNIKVKHCSFSGIRLTRNAIRIISSAVMSEIHDSIFIFSGTESIGGAVSQVAIKIEQTDRVEVHGCKFLFQTPAPAAATLTVKAVEFTRVNHARISDCRAYAGSVPASTTYIFAELVHATSIAGNIAITGNVVRGLNYFIRQATQYQKVTVSGNNYTNHQGAGAAIDLASGNVEWAIVGNVLDGTTGVNLQAGADNNVVIGNKAVVVNAGTGNTVASNFVTGLRKEGEASALAGDVKLRAGSNITLTQDGPGNAIEIAAAGGGVTSLRKTGDPTGLTGAVSVDQGSDISVTQDTPNNKLVVSYSGPKGYATVIAPVPNGTNDTTNLQTTLDAIPSGTGGVVILREGVYRVDSLTLQRTGTRLVGSGSGRDTGSDAKGTQIRSTGFSGDILKIQASNVTIENITFYGLQMADGFAIISGNPSIQITRCEIRGCLFDGIKAAVDGIRLPLVFFLSITDCQFWMSEIAAQSVSRTPNAIKIGPTTFGFSLDEVLITNCVFRINYPNPTAGTITAKAIDLTKVKSAVIANCQALGINADANRTYIFLELKQDGGIGSNAAVKGNSISSFTHFIQQTSGFLLVAVGSNVLSNPIGTAYAIDLAGGNIGWAITGNVFDGNGVNLQSGTQSCAVVGNVSLVTNAGAGNIVASNA